jgi:hypothetical protein
LIVHDIDSVGIKKDQDHRSWERSKYLWLVATEGTGGRKILRLVWESRRV